MKKYLNENTVKLLKNAIGEIGIKYLDKSSLMFSSLIHSSNPEVNGNIILKNKYTPNFIEDWKVYMILRAHCNSIITTGKNLREEQDLNIFHNLDFNNYDDVERYFYRINQTSLCDEGHKSESRKEEENIYKKNILFLSRSITKENVLNMKVFREKYARKFLINNLKLVNFHLENNKFLTENEIHLINDKIEGFDDLVTYLRNITFNCTPIMAEVGPQTFKNILEDANAKNKVDFILMSVYNGIIDRNFIGSSFPSLNELDKSYELIHTSEKIQCEKGDLTFFTLVHRNII